MSDNSLVPYNMLGDGLKILEFHKDRCVVDLNHFFKDWFAMRDVQFGRSKHQRWEEKGDVTRYQFTFRELYETFLASYKSSDLAGFFKNHMDIENNSR